MNKTKVFTAGKQVDYTYSNSDVKAVAEGYTETAYSAPWICGHEATSGKPAMGWVRGLEYTEENGVGELWAISEFNIAGQALIDAGLFENKSVSFYTPDSAFNPAPGQWSLRHIAMLGAEPPALKNLGPIAVIDYSEEDTTYVTYACSCMENKGKLPAGNKLEMTEETKSENDLEKMYTELQSEFAALKQELENVKNSAVKENIKELDKEMEETKVDMQAELSELEQVKKERDQLMAQLNASKEANTALSVSAAISPYYSEGVLTEDVLPESTLTNVITKLTLGSTNYAEEETPIIVIEKLLQALIGSKPVEPEYGEATAAEDFVAQSPSYSDGDELHELAVKTASTYGLSYGQALSAVVTASENTSANKVNFSESLADAVKTFKTSK